MAIETQELAIIKSGISTAMSASAGEFRQAATASAASITKVVKDISSIFAAQKRDLAELTNSINEVVHELEQTNSKFDTLERVFEESLSIQTAMRGDLKTMAISMKNMTDGIYQLDRNMQNVMTGPNSLLSGLTAGLTSGFGGVTGKLGELLLKVGVPLAAGAAAGGAIGYTMGGGGSDSGGGSSSGGGGGHYKLTAEQKKEMATAIRQTSKDIGIQPENLAAIMSFETGGTLDPWKAGPVTKYGQHRGLIQWGEPQAREFGVGPETSITDQVKAAGKYLQQRGVKPGMPLENIYSAVIHGNATSGLDVPDKFGTTARSGAANMMRTAHIHALENLEKGTNSKEENEKSNPLNNSDATPVSQNPVTSTSSGGNTPSVESKNTDKKQESAPVKSVDASKVKLIERYGPGRPERPDDSILNIAKKAAAGAGMESITATSGKGNFISAAGRAKGQKTTMHSTGLAVDLAGFQNDQQKLEFIKQAKEAGAKGVGIYDNGSVHIDLGRERSWNWGFKDKEAFDAAVKTSSSNQGDVVPKIGPEAPQATEATRVSATPVGSTGTEAPSPVTPTAAAAEQATPVSQESVSPGVSSAMTGADTSAMMGMMGGGMLPGGLGGIIEMIGPMIESLLGSLDPSQAFAQENYQTQNAEMLQTLSKSAAASESIRQAAIQSQAPQLEESATPSQSIATMPSAPSSVGGYNFQQPGYAYNFDVGWADWAARLGGNHWKEMQKYKESLIS